MKKLLSIMMILMLALALLTACAPAEEPAEEPAAPAEEQTPAEEPAEEPAAETDVVAEAALAYFANFPDSKHMANAEDIVAKVLAGEELFILDIRSAEDYAAGHLKGAYNVPYLEVGNYLEQLPDDVEIFVQCYTGQTSSQTVALLNIAGKFATNVQKGFKNGVSQVEGYEEAITTEAAALPEGNYPVDDAIEEAIKAYYAEAGSNTFKSFNISVEQVKELVDAGSTDYTILSVRQAADYEAGHVQGAINIPFGAGMQEQFESLIPKDKPVIVYCYTGQTASQTVAVLRMLGYEAYNMSQGITNGWEPAGYELVTD